MAYHCESCSFRSHTWKFYLRHSFEAHSCDPAFSVTCRVNGCPRTFRTYSAMKAHLSRNHPNSPDPPLFGRSLSPAANSQDVCPEHNVAGSSGGSPPQAEAMQDPEQFTLSAGNGSPRHKSATTHAALLLLTLKEKHRLTQTSVDFAVQQIQDIVDYTINDIRSSVEKQVAEYCTTIGVNSPDLTLCFPDTSPFSGLESEYLQTKFYKENFNLVVSGKPSSCCTMHAYLIVL